MKPDAFFFTQVFTLGESNMREMELIYMSPFDAVLWFFVEFFILPERSVVAFLWVSTFWWVYLAGITWSITEAFFGLFDGLFDFDDEDDEEK